MSFVYVTEHGATLGTEGGCLTISHTDKTKDSIPKELVEGISIFGKSQLSAALVQYCLERGIRVSFFSYNGSFYGSLMPTNSVNVYRLRKQIEVFGNEELALMLSKRIVYAKIKNQLVVIKRYLRHMPANVQEELFCIRNCKRKIEYADKKEQLRGYEGLASRCYFRIIGSILPQEYGFYARKRPATDPVNCMLNLGYSILLKEISGEIDNRGLNAYISFLHEDKANCPTLACDMIEEWRAAIVDSTVLGMILGHEISIEMFQYDSKGICTMNSEAMKLFFIKLEKKMHTENQYLSYINKPVTFRQSIWHQAGRLAKAVETTTPDYYEPIELR